MLIHWIFIHSTLLPPSVVFLTVTALASSLTDLNNSGLLGTTWNLFELRLHFWITSHHCSGIKISVLTSPLNYARICIIRKVAVAWNHKSMIYFNDICCKTEVHPHQHHFEVLVLTAASITKCTDDLNSTSSSVWAVLQQAWWDLLRTSWCHLLVPYVHQYFSSAQIVYAKIIHSSRLHWLSVVVLTAPSEPSPRSLLTAQTLWQECMTGRRESSVDSLHRRTAWRMTADSPRSLSTAQTLWQECLTGRRSPSMESLHRSTTWRMTADSPRSLLTAHALWQECLTGRRSPSVESMHRRTAWRMTVDSPRSLLLCLLSVSGYRVRYAVHASTGSKSYIRCL